MNKTDFHLYDFLDFDPTYKSANMAQRLWRAERPVHIEQSGTDIFLTLPFKLQKPKMEMEPEMNVATKNHKLVLRCYDSGILRVGLDLGKGVFFDSPMLCFDDSLITSSLGYEVLADRWIIRDNKGMIRAVILLQDPEIDYWSDLLPPPQESFQIIFYPDGETQLPLSAFDQFFPGRMDALGLALIEKQGLPEKVVFSLHADAHERFAGTGERFRKLDLAGDTFELRNRDGQGVNNRRSYKNVPFYLSSKGYGLFMHTSSQIKLSIADFSSRSVMGCITADTLDLFLMADKSPERILYQYRCITGFPSLPPLWSFGVWMSRMTYFSEEEVNIIVDRLRTEDYPCDVIHLDTGWFKTDWLCEWKFNPERFPNPQRFVKNLAEKGFKVSLWQMPYIGAEAEQYKEARDNQYMAAMPKSERQSGSNFSTLDYAGTIDFTNPEAVEWYKNLLRNLLKLGVACIKTDFGEEIHMEAQYKEIPPDKLVNLYALLYQKAAFEVTEEITGEALIWARAGWAGCQRYPIHWGGDAAASWDGMAGSLKGGLHLGLSGFGFWSHDIPGFHGVPNFMNSVVPDDLYMRWTQFGVFSSHIRYHGTSKREPYHYPNIASSIRKWWHLRYALIPYIWEQSKKTTLSGFPVLRALALHHPQDRMCWHIDDQYYFGDDFLVAPVMASNSQRDVYLPDGDWVNFFNGEGKTGPYWLKNIKVPMEEMPVWVKKDTVLPWYPGSVAHTGEMDMAKVIQVRIDDKFKGMWNLLGYGNPELNEQH